MNHIFCVGECRGKEALMGKEIWQVVSENLQAGMTVRNWTVNRGYLGDDIIIQDIGENFVEVAAPDSKTGEVTSVRVPQQDFEYVYTNWDAYLAGDMTRHELRANCRNTRYVIDVLRHLSEQGLI